MSDGLDNADIVVAVTQAGLNQRLGRLFCAEQLLPDVGWQVVRKSGASLAGYPCLREVSLSTMGARDEVLVTLRVVGEPTRPASFTYWSFDDDGTPTQATRAFQELVYRFHAPMGLTPVADLRALATRRGVPGAAAARLAALDPTTDTVRLVTVDLSDPSNYDVDQSWLDPGDGAPVVQFKGIDQVLAIQSLQKVVAALLQPVAGSSPIVLGYAVTTTAPPVGSWAPTAAAVTTWDDPADSSRNTLNFVLNTGGRALGSNDGWLKATLIPSPPPPGLQGRLAISSRLFLDDYVQRLLARIHEALDLPASAPFARVGTLTKWTTTSTQAPPPAVTGGAISSSVTRTDVRSCTATLTNEGSSAGGGSSVRLSGVGSIVLSFKQDVGAPLSKTVATLSSRIDFTFGVWLLAGPDGTIVGGWQPPGSPAPVQSVWEDPVFLAEDKVMAMLDQPTVQGHLQGMAAAMKQLETSRLDALNDQTVALLNDLRTTVTLPFGEALFFKNLSIDGEGNLLAEVRWKASTVSQDPA